MKLCRRERVRTRSATVPSRPSTRRGRRTFHLWRRFRHRNYQWLRGFGASVDAIQLLTSSFSYLTAGVSQGLRTSRPCWSTPAKAFRPDDLRLHGDSLDADGDDIATIAANPPRSTSHDSAEINWSARSRPLTRVGRLNGALGRQGRQARPLLRRQGNSSGCATNAFRRPLSALTACSRPTLTVAFGEGFGTFTKPRRMAAFCAFLP